MTRPFLFGWLTCPVGTARPDLRVAWRVDWHWTWPSVPRVRACHVVCTSLRRCTIVRGAGTLSGTRSGMVGACLPTACEGLLLLMRDLGH